MIRRSQALLFIALVSRAHGAEVYDPSNDLMSAFGGKCKGRGILSQEAISESNSLKSIIDSIRSDQNCNAISGTLEKIENLNIPNLVRDRRSKDDLESLSALVNDLQMAVAANATSEASDASYTAALNSEYALQTTQLLKARRYQNQARFTRRLDAIENYQSYSNALFDQLRAAKDCFKGRPHLEAQIGAQVVGLGAGLAGGVIGSVILAAANVIDNFITYYRDRNLGQQMAAVVNNRVGDAIGCSFEGLAATYCQARDVETVIATNRTQSETKPAMPPWLAGAGLFGQDLRAYEDWIQGIDAGSPAGTPGRGEDKKVALADQARLKLTKIDLEQVLLTGRRTYEQVDEDRRVGVTRKVLNDLAAKLTGDRCSGDGCPPPNSPYDLFVADPICGPYIYFYSGGIERTRVDDDGTSACGQYLINRFKDKLPDLRTGVEQQVNRLMTEASSNVAGKLSQVNESNPNLALARSNSRSANGRTAHDFLQSSSAYLEDLLNDPNSVASQPTQRDLITRTKLRIDTALTILANREDQAKSPGQTAEPGKKVVDLSAQLIPLGDTAMIPRALNEIVNQDLDLRAARGEIDKNMATIMQMSNTDSLSELIRNFIGLEAAKTQARTAKTLTKTNLTTLAETFSEPFLNRLAGLAEEAKGDLGTVCKGAVYNSVYESSGIKLSYDELAKAAYPVRACAVFDFYRKSYLYGLKTNRRPPSATPMDRTQPTR